MSFSRLLAIIPLTPRLVTLIFASNFPDMAQEDMPETPPPLGKYERLFHRAYILTLLSRAALVLFSDRTPQRSQLEVRVFTEGS